MQAQSRLSRCKIRLLQGALQDERTMHIGQDAKTHTRHV